MSESVDVVLIGELKDLFTKLCALEDDVCNSTDSLSNDLAFLKEDMQFARKCGMADSANEIEKQIRLYEMLLANFKTKCILVKVERINVQAHILKYAEADSYSNFCLSDQLYDDRLSNLKNAVNDVLTKLE